MNGWVGGWEGGKGGGDASRAIRWSLEGTWMTRLVQLPCAKHCKLLLILLLVLNISVRSIAVLIMWSMCSLLFMSKLSVWFNAWCASWNVSRTQCALGLPTLLICSILGYITPGSKMTCLSGSSRGARMMCPKSLIFLVFPSHCKVSVRVIKYT